MKMRKLESRGGKHPSALWGVVEFPGMVVGKIDDDASVRVGIAPSRSGSRWEVWVDLSQAAQHSEVWDQGQVEEARQWLWSLEEDPDESELVKRFEMGWQIANELSKQSFTTRKEILQAIKALKLIKQLAC